jgi:hypothetical protein
MIRDYPSWVRQPVLKVGTETGHEKPDVEPASEPVAYCPAFTGLASVLTQYTQKTRSCETLPMSLSDTQPEQSPVADWSEPRVGEALKGMNPADQLRRKIRVTKIIALVEAVSYCFVAFFMFRKYVLDMRGGWNQFGLRFVAYFHGMFCIAFAVMIFDIFRAMKWTKQFVVVTLLGPPGALIAHHRLRTQPFPTDVRKQDMIF